MSEVCLSFEKKKKSSVASRVHKYRNTVLATVWLKGLKWSMSMYIQSSWSYLHDWSGVMKKSSIEMQLIMCP